MFILEECLYRTMLCGKKKTSKIKYIINHFVNMRTHSKEMKNIYVTKCNSCNS